MTDSPEPASPPENAATRAGNLGRLIDIYERDLMAQAERAATLTPGAVKTAARTAAAEIAMILGQLRVIAELDEQRALSE